MDLILWTPGATVFTPSIERGLAARLRTEETIPIVLGAGFRRPDYRLDSQIIDHHGITQGSGLQSAVDTVITSSGRNLRPTCTEISLERVHGTLHSSLLSAAQPWSATDIRTGTWTQWGAPGDRIRCTLAPTHGRRPGWQESVTGGC